MTPFDPAQGAQAIYNFWLGLIPQFLGQFGGAVPGTQAGASAKPDAGDAAAPSALIFPVDQIARAATMTQESLQAFAQAVAPLIQAGGVPGLLNQWATAIPAFALGKPGDAAAAATQPWTAPWNALMAGASGAAPFAAPQASPPPPLGAGNAPTVAWQAMTQPWVDMASAMAGATPAQLTTAFDRTYGALSDALGLSPARKLSTAWQDLVAAGIAQQEARTRYALLVQSAFAQGFQRLLTELAGKANSGERIASVLGLLRLWAMKTEEVVHETLQSDAGLAATAALTRSALIYRKKMQHVASIIADAFDMATRRELDEAYREIQALKRELRASGAVRAPGNRGDATPDTGAR
jgi:hypothetical protein